MTACVEMMSVRCRKPASFVSKPGEYAWTEKIGRHNPSAFDSMARPAQPLSDVRVGSKVTWPASGRWYSCAGEVCVSAMASALPVTRDITAEPSRIHDFFAKLVYAST